MRLLPTTNGPWAMVSDEDFHTCLAYTWSLNKSGYPQGYRTGARKKGDHGVFYLHKFIAQRMGLGDCEIDHKDEVKHNCQRGNLRPATRAQNVMNQGPRKSNKLGVKGVRFLDGRYYARIMVDGKEIPLGGYATLDEASAARLGAERYYFGEFAKGR